MRRGETVEFIIYNYYRGINRDYEYVSSRNLKTEAVNYFQLLYS